MNVYGKCSAVVGFVLIWVLVGCLIPVVQLSENQALYVFSSQAQIVAAIYGLTITGYIFLHAQQERLADKDDTIVGALNDIKVAQHSFITFLTIISLSSIFIALLAIVFLDSSSALLKIFTQNSAASLFVVALICTGYFVHEAMRPNKIEEASERIKKEIEERSKQSSVSLSEAVEENVDVRESLEAEHLDDGTNTASDNPGDEKESSFVEFLKSYNYIERSLDVFMDLYLKSTIFTADDLSRYPSYQEDKFALRSGWPKVKVVKAMLDKGFISPKFADDLDKLIRYRNALVHGRDFSVSNEVVELAKVTVVELNRILHKIAG